MLRRGFKSEAEQRAVAIRRELGLTPTDPLRPEQLASHLRVGYRSAEELVPMEALEELDRIPTWLFLGVYPDWTTGPGCHRQSTQQPSSTAERRHARTQPFVAAP